MFRIGEYLFKTEDSWHSTLNEITDKGDFGAVPENGFYARIVVFAFGCFACGEAEEF